MGLIGSMRHETPLSTEQNRAQAPPWLSGPHGDQGRTQSPCPPPGSRSQKAVRLSGQFGPAASGLVMKRLKVRSDFLRAARGVRRNVASMMLELCATPRAASEPGVVRVGFTASRNIGGAVERNRAKRRLRAAAAALLPLYGREGNDYVLVARRETLTRSFPALLDDLATALHAAHAKLGRLTAGEQR